MNLTVKKDIYDALVKNGGIVEANGGYIYLTANGADELLKSVVNNTGVLEAQTLGDVDGRIEVYAHGGTANIGGTISTGAGKGFVETSGDTVKFAKGTSIVSGDWLIDPADITVDADNG